MRKSPMIAGAVLAAALAIAGCSSQHASSISSQFHGPSASALASVPGADAKQVLVKAGVPIHGTSAQQIAFGKTMLTKAGRHALAVKLEIPPQNVKPFEAALLDAAKADHVLTSHKGRVKFLDVDAENAYARFA